MTSLPKPFQHPAPHITRADVPLTDLEERLRELTESRRHAVAELPPTSWTPQDKTPKPTAEEAQR